MLKNLKMLREDVGISQKALAEAIGVSQQSVNKYENHNIEPDIETLVRIADYFNTSVDFLIGHSTVQQVPSPIGFEVNTDERQLLGTYRKLSASQKEAVLTVLRSYLS